MSRIRHAFTIWRGYLLQKMTLVQDILLLVHLTIQSRYLFLINRIHLPNSAKIWQIEQTRISLKPLHTLHAGYPIGKIGWRPSFETEIVVLPYHSGASGKPSSSKSTTVSEASERFAPQIWDVRNGWLAKWSMPPIDGPATGESLSQNPPDFGLTMR